MPYILYLLLQLLSTGAVVEPHRVGTRRACIFLFTGRNSRAPRGEGEIDTPPTRRTTNTTSSCRDALLFSAMPNMMPAREVLLSTLSHRATNYFYNANTESLYLRGGPRVYPAAWLVPLAAPRLPTNTSVLAQRGGLYVD